MAKTNNPYAPDFQRHILKLLRNRRTPITETVTHLLRFMARLLGVDSEIMSTTFAASFVAVMTSFAFHSVAHAGGTVGTGTPESCDEEAFHRAFSGGGEVRFNCGAGEHQIRIIAAQAITDDTVVYGDGRIVLDGNNETRIFVVDSEARFELHGLILAHGNAMLADRSGMGGAVFNAGRLVLVNTEIRNSQAATSGGGIWNEGGTIRLLKSTVQANGTCCTSVLLAGGGGIASEGGTIEIIETTIANNSSHDMGGGIFVTDLRGGGSLKIERSTISGNSTINGGGGGIMIFGMNSDLVNSTVYENEAGRAGGGIGVVHCLDPYECDGVRKVSLSQVTISENHTAGRCDDCYWASGGIHIGRRVQVITQNSIIARNTNAGRLVDCTSSQRDLFQSKGGNLFGHTLPAPVGWRFPCQVTDADLVGRHPRLDPLGLRANGGPTNTPLLRATSPAIDAGVGRGCPSEDQRGAVRPVDGDGTGGAKCDIGAVEMGRGTGVSSSGHPCLRDDELGRFLRFPEIRCRWPLELEDLIVERSVPLPVEPGSVFSVAWRVIGTTRGRERVTVHEQLPKGFATISGKTALDVSFKTLETKLAEQRFMVRAPRKAGTYEMWAIVEAHEEQPSDQGRGNKEQLKVKTVLRVNGGDTNSRSDGWEQ